MEAKISTYIIGIVMFTLFIVGGISLISIISETDGNFIDDYKYEQFNNTVNKRGEVIDRLETISSGVQDASLEQGVLGVLSSLISTTWNTIKTIPTLFSFMGTAYVDLAVFFGIPAWIPGLLLGIITIIIIFTIYGAIFQQEM